MSEQIAFRMNLYPGQAREYRKRHDEIFPELSKALKDAGVSDYSIWLDPESNHLFGILTRAHGEEICYVPTSRVQINPRRVDHAIDEVIAGRAYGSGGIITMRDIRPEHPSDGAGQDLTEEQAVQAWGFSIKDFAPKNMILPVLLKAQARAIGDGRTGTPWLPNFRLDPADLVEAPTWSRGVVAAIEAAIAQNGGDIERLDRQSEQALRLLREVGDTWGIALASQMRSEWLMLHGRLEEALEITDAASRALEGLTSASDQLQQQAFAIVLLVRLGRVDEARERLAGMQEAARRDGSDRDGLQAAITAVTFEVIMGDGPAALSLLETLPLALRDGSLPGIPPQIHAWMHSRHAQALVLAERFDEARAQVRVGIELAIGSGDQPIMADAALAAAELFAATGRPDDARHALALAAVLRGRADETDPVVQRVRARIGTDAGPDASASGPADLADLVALL